MFPFLVFSCGRICMIHGDDSFGDCDLCTYILPQKHHYGFLLNCSTWLYNQPIYIKANERTEYHKAMNLANNENDYTAIKQFYRYKVCDSIIELDINERLKEEEKPKQIKKTK